MVNWLVVQCAHLEKYELMSMGRMIMIIAYMKWKIKAMFETTRIHLISVEYSDQNKINSHNNSNNSKNNSKNNNNRVLDPQNLEMMAKTINI
jgi:hypothetical protein